MGDQGLISKGPPAAAPVSLDKRMDPISLHTKFEPNPCMHAHITAVFVHTQPF